MRSRYTLTSWQFVYWREVAEEPKLKIYRHCARGRALARMAAFMARLPALEMDEEDADGAGPWRVDEEVRRLGPGSAEWKDIYIPEICPAGHPLLNWLP